MSVALLLLNISFLEVLATRTVRKEKETGLDVEWEKSNLVA